MRRRSFLRGAGGVVVGLPFLESLTARGAPPDGSPRFVTMFHSQGTLLDSWVPAQTGSGFELSEVLTPLAPVRDKVNVLSGISNGITNILGAGHGISTRTLMTAMPAVEHIQPDGSLDHAYGEPLIGAGPSIDQELASRIGGAAPHRSIDLCAGGSTGSGLLFAGEADPVSLEPDPRAAFDRLFADFDPEPSTPTTLDRIRARRGSVLDAVGQSFTGLRGRVSKADRQRLDAHADKIRTLEERIGLGPLECDQPAMELPEGYDFSSSDHDDVTAEHMVDIAAMALACGLTNVASLTFSQGHTPRFPWLGEDIPGDYGLWHEMIHLAADSSSRPAMIAVFQWYASMFERFASNLDAYDDGDGTVLDNTVMLWASDFGDGARHSSRDLPIVLAGGACGALATGRHLDYADHTFGDLAASLLELFGYPGETFGWPDATTGPLPGL